MSYYVRLMSREDALQVTEIDREAFPTMLPPVNYRRELENKLAHYIVACDQERRSVNVEAQPVNGGALSEMTSRFFRLFGRESFSGKDTVLPTEEYIAGFAGIWYMGGEAHLISIAVREEYRRQGLGELLVISIIDVATELNAHLVTLEVRVSNTLAQRLYKKYGFTQVGLRRHYYTDNREDGVLMTAENITTALFQSRVQRLKREHSKKYGVALYEIVS